VWRFSWRLGPTTVRRSDEPSRSCAQTPLLAPSIQPCTMVFVPPWRQRSRLRYHVGVLPASTQRTVAEGWATYFVAAGALSTLDTALVLARGATVSVSLHYLAVSVALAAWVAMPCACVFTLVVLVGRALARPAEHLPAWLRCGLVGAGGGALAGAAGLMLLRPWDLAIDPHQLTALVPTACTAAGAATGLIWPRLPAPALVALLGAGALVSLAGDAFVMPGLYRTFHNLAAFLALQTAMLAAWRLRARFTVRRRLLAIVALAAATHVAVILDVHAVRLAAQRYGTLHDQWLAFVHRLVDLDRDGFSPLFWGGDCNDRDARIAPGRCEVPGNRIDDNCNGHTDVSGVAAPISKAPRTLRDPRPDVYVIVVDALRADLAGLGRSSHAVPALARLARSGLDFTRAYTAYPSTYRALSSVAQSGRAPSPPCQI